MLDNLKSFSFDKSDPTWVIALKDAKQLAEFTKIQKMEIDEANSPGGSSKGIELIFKKKLEGMGYTHEPRKEYPERALCPDYVKKTETGGIILEVERGKTIDNNMDMLDFWKTHIHKDCNHLILLVPLELQHRKGGTITKAFDKVCRRLDDFFSPGNETNVKGLVVIGY